jgi:hypothetical protein
MNRIRRTLMAIAMTVLVASLASSAFGQVVLDNGLPSSTPGFWQAYIQNGGYCRTGNLTATGSTSPENVIYDYFSYVDYNGVGINLADTSIDTPVTLTDPTHAMSAGHFTGSNGVINWTSISTIAPNSPILQTNVSFSSQDPLGNLSFIQYLDEDVRGARNDNLIVIGTPGASDFQLLTVASNAMVGVAQSAIYTPNNMTYIGWAGDWYPTLKSEIGDGSAAYSIAGVTGALNSMTDVRFPGLPAYGTGDITTALAFNASPTATQASVVLGLGGAPTGIAPPINNNVPEPGMLAMLGGGILPILGFAVRRFRA